MELRYIYFDDPCDESSPVTEKPEKLKSASMAFPGDTDGGSKRRGAAEVRDSSASRRLSVGGPDGGWAAVRQWCGQEIRERREKEIFRERERERRREGID
ncbi:hypothetical protein PanWU01x14_149730 [Parasponia andersonii]|uniref:Uncharacterized protein n=1 Tax=Parasponia andersonii TaxID=3476 RepID=A0A2P5CIK9_PARAD|nr:hypothetical protein PanWU01x14_149730 [Parasponia andersonii]